MEWDIFRRVTFKEIFKLRSLDTSWKREADSFLSAERSILCMAEIIPQETTADTETEVSAFAYSHKNHIPFAMNRYVTRYCELNPLITYCNESGDWCRMPINTRPFPKGFKCYSIAALDSGLLCGLLIKDVHSRNTQHGSTVDNEIKAIVFNPFSGCTKLLPRPPHNHLLKHETMRLHITIHNNECAEGYFVVLSSLSKLFPFAQGPGDYLDVYSSNSKKWKPVQLELEAAKCVCRSEIMTGNLLLEGDLFVSHGDERYLHAYNFKSNSWNRTQLANNLAGCDYDKSHMFKGKDTLYLAAFRPDFQGFAVNKLIGESLAKWEEVSRTPRDLQFQNIAPPNYVSFVSSDSYVCMTIVTKDLQIMPPLTYHLQSNSWEWLRPNYDSPKCLIGLFGCACKVGIKP